MKPITPNDSGDGKTYRVLTKPWSPSEGDKAWMVRHLNMIKQGGIWGVPCCAGVYEVLHDTKTLRCTTAVDGTNYDRISICAKSIGWEVVDARQNN
jgi:hypothetical protein